jgi:molybdate transport system ATP-binding protein
MNLELDLRLDRPDFRLQVRGRVDARVTGLFGPSGSGKTTLLHAIAGLVRSASGRIVLDGRCLQDSDRGLFVPPHRRGIGVAFQDHRLLPHLSVRGNLGLGRPGRTRHDRRIDEVAELLEISELLDRHVGALSGGQGQRVALGRALLAARNLLLLDEPLASLDVQLRYRILPVLRRIRDAAEVPVLIVSHDLTELLELTDHLAVLDRGRLIAQGSFVDLARHERTLQLMHDLGVPNRLPLRVVRNRPREGISLCRLQSDRPDRPGPLCHLPLLDRPEGALVHATCRAEEISLSRRPVEGVSIQNQLPGRVIEQTRVGDRSVCVVDVGIPLLVEITPRAGRLLGLAPGREVVCLFKTRSIRPLPGEVGEPAGGAERCGG